MKLIKKQLMIILIFSFLISIGSIIHGIYMDLDFTQIKRLTIEGIILTLIIIFPAILILEKIFDINNSEGIDKINKRLNKIESKIRGRK